MVFEKIIFGERQPGRERLLRNVTEWEFLEEKLIKRKFGFQYLYQGARTENLNLKEIARYLENFSLSYYSEKVS